MLKPSCNTDIYSFMRLVIKTRMEEMMEGKATANYKEQKDTFAWQVNPYPKSQNILLSCGSVFAWCQMF
jgi:hypothetical protein